MKKSFVLVLALFSLLVVQAPQATAASKWRGVTADGSITDQQISTLGSWKANLVYFFLNPEEFGHATDEASYLANLNLAFPKLDEKIGKFGQQGIKVAISLYGPPGGSAGQGTGHALFREAWAQNALVSAWRTIASRYAGNPYIFGYNLLNEPAQVSVGAGLKKWSDLAAEVVRAIRQADSTVNVIIQPPFGDYNRFGALKPIKGDRNITYAFNMYYPWKFTHQGLYGVRVGSTYPTRATNRAKLEKSLKRAFIFQRKYKVKLYVPEFTAARWAPGNSAFVYLRDVIKILERHGVSWTYHSYGGVDSAPSYAYPWSLELGSDPNSTTPAAQPTTRLKLLQSYFNRNKR